MRELRMMALPPDPLVWAVVILGGVFGLAAMFSTFDAPRTIARGVRSMARRRDPN